jgi:Spermidine synthase
MLNQRKILLSYLYPIVIERIRCSNGKEAQLKLYFNQLQLTYHDAIYSFGTMYHPFVKTLKIIQGFLPDVKHMVMLGSGLGSGLKILQTKYQLFPESILVDKEEEIIRLSQDYMKLNSQQNVSWINQDAMDYLKTCSKKSDLILIDLFEGMEVDGRFKQIEFYQSLKQVLSQNGIAIFNYAPKSMNEKKILIERLEKSFAWVKHLSHPPNEYFIVSECEYNF